MFVFGVWEILVIPYTSKKQTMEPENLLPNGKWETSLFNPPYHT